MTLLFERTFCCVSYVIWLVFDLVGWVLKYFVTLVLMFVDDALCSRLRCLVMFILDRVGLKGVCPVTVDYWRWLDIRAPLDKSCIYNVV